MFPKKIDERLGMGNNFQLAIGQNIGQIFSDSAFWLTSSGKRRVW